MVIVRDCCESQDKLAQGPYFFSVEQAYREPERLIARSDPVMWVRRRDCFMEMADSDVVSSNTIFEVLEDWNAQLSHTDFANFCEEWEDKLEGAQP